MAIRAAAKPDAPPKPSKKASELTTITIQWSAPSYNGGNAVTDYSIYMDDGLGGGVFTLQGQTGDPSILEFQVTGLTNSHEYNFKVSAHNQVGEGPQSDSEAILAATVPEAPAEPITSAQTSSSVTISWVEPLNNGSNIDDYKVLWCFGSDSSCTFSTVVTSTGGATSQTVSGLSKGNYYQFKVQAHNTIGFSEASVAHLTIAADVPLEPDTPERVHASTD